jgi:hypothetical protein
VAQPAAGSAAPISKKATAEPDVQITQSFGWKRFQRPQLALACAPALPLRQCLGWLRSVDVCLSRSDKKRTPETGVHRFRRSGRLAVAWSDKRAKKRRILCLSIRFRQPFRVGIEHIKHTSASYQHRDRNRTEHSLLPVQCRQQASPPNFPHSLRYATSWPNPRAGSALNSSPSRRLHST